MNQYRRKHLSEASEMLQNAMSIVDSVREDEQDSLDNIPENLQSSDRYSQMEDAIELMEDAVDDIKNAIESINSACEKGG